MNNLRRALTWRATVPVIGVLAWLVVPAWLGLPACLGVPAWLGMATSAAAPPATTRATPPPTTPAAPPGSPGAAAPPGIVALLQSLPLPGLEPGLQWDWDPTAFEPLVHPVLDDFRWRQSELRKRNLPAIVRARLNLELAFLGAARRNGPIELRRLASPDSLTPDARAVRARQAYAGLLETTPDNGEFLTDLGDLHRFMGHPDSALVSYRQALAAPRVPSRLYARLANAELERLAMNPAASAEAAFRDVLNRGQKAFANAAPADSLRAARFHLERGKFRIDRAILEVRADRLLHPERWRSAGADSLFRLMTRVVAPETRRAFQAAAEGDTNLAEAHGLLGSIVTGQIFLPIAAEGMLLRQHAATRDSLASGLWALLARRRDQRRGDAEYAAANMNRCELLEPGRYVRARADQARLAVLLADLDGAAGLWRSLMVRDPDAIGAYATELYTTHALERPSGLPSGLPIAGRLERAVSEAITANTGATGAMNPGAMALLGVLRDDLGRHDEARRDLGRAAAIDTTAWRARLGLAILSLREMDPPAAESHLQYAGLHFADLDERAQGLYCGAVGLLYAARRDTANAQRWLAEAVRFDPLEPIFREAARRTAAAP